MVTGVILRKGLAVFRLLILMLFMTGLFCGTISAADAANPADEWVGDDACRQTRSRNTGTGS